MEAIKKQIKEMLDGGFSKKGRYFAMLMQFLVVSALMALSLEILPEKDLEGYYGILDIFKWVAAGGGIAAT